MFRAMWRLLAVAVLLSGCSLPLPAVHRPTDVDCRDVSDDVCDEAWAAAGERFPPAGDIEGATVSVAGGAAECVPGPCADLFEVALNLREGHTRIIVLERQTNGDLAVTEVHDAIP